MLEVQTVTLDAVLLRGLLPDLRLREGTTLVGRVLERHGAHGLLALAAALVVAALPDELAAGARVRLAVADLSGEQVVLRVVEHLAAAEAGLPAPAPAPGAPAPGAAPLGVPVPVPLPGGLQARVTVTERDARGPDGEPLEPGTASVALLYDSPRHGRIELRLAVAADAVRATVGAPSDSFAALAGERAGELRAALAQALGRLGDVAVTGARARVDRRA